MWYDENVEANVPSYGNSFYGAFVQAYNYHKDLILSPDDVWMQITLSFAKYIDKHAEEMRDMFVEHEGKKKLTVTTGEYLDESEWKEFFDKIIVAINNNTKELCLS